MAAAGSAVVASLALLCCLLTCVRSARPQGCQVANLLAFAANVYFVQSVPRLDSKNYGQLPLNFLTPAPYAFAIWAVIYMSEAAFVCWQLFQRFPSAPRKRLSLLSDCAPWWCAANACQVLWCLTFTPRFDSPGLLWISAVALSGIALCLGQAHAVVAAGTLDRQETFLLYAPISVHFGWTSAAALVNWNGYFARCGLGNGTKFNLLLLSLFLATALGVVVSNRRKSVLYGITVAWALVAVGRNTWQDQRFAEAMGLGPAGALGNLEVALGALVVAAVAGTRMRK
mmetsp:Transcript_162544/g.521061  ORF Transcript_162544/g.521061 Transcript_162544/m.521061 type:complete len:285 (-) Transcript_162544:97-951(-)